MVRMVSIFVVLLAVTSCTWVTLDKAAETVMVKTESDVANCKKVARTTVSLRSKVMGIQRNKEKVQKELEVLARNAAVDYQGNTVVPSSPIEEGKQSFDVYQCP